MNRFSLVALPAAALSLLIAAQPATAQKKGNSEPLELPEFVITGKETISIPGGQKASPSPASRLSKAELDSLNPLNKLAPRTLAQPKPPQQVPYRHGHSGWVRGDLGLYLTPSVDAGYALSFDGYRLDVRGNFVRNGAYIDNADNTNLNVGAELSYVAPEKFLFFGGSLTRTWARFGTTSYSLFAVPQAPARSQTSLSAGVLSEGEWEGATFSTGVRFDRDAFDGLGNTAGSDLRAHVDVTLPLQGGTTLGGMADLSFQSADGNGLSLIDLRAQGGIEAGDLRLKASAGIQLASSSFDRSLTAPAVDARAELLMSRTMTATAKIYTGRHHRTFGSLLRSNPYLADSVELAFSKSNIQAEAGLRWLPSPTAGLTASAGFASNADIPIFAFTPNGSFALAYASTTDLYVQAEGFWLVSDSDKLQATIRILSSTLDSGGTTPYAEPVRASLDWNHTFSETFSAWMGLTYVAERKAGASVNLSPYVDLSAGARIALSQDLAGWIRLENIINQDIFLFQGYKQRTIFASVGVSYRW